MDNSFSLLTNSNFTYPTSLLVAETVCRLTPVVSCKTLSFEPKSSSNRAYVTNGGGSPVFRRAFKEDELSTTASLDSKSLSRENLMSLFKRIQIEISQGESESESYSKSSQGSIDDDSPVETSVVEFLKQSDWETKGSNSKLEQSEESNRHVKTTKTEKSIPTLTSSSTSKSTRPRSNFVKKSPIPSSNPSQSTDAEVGSNTKLPSSEADKGPSSVERMKLTELKELAKGRGLKGYSKLKKIELIQLLKSTLPW